MSPNPPSRPSFSPSRRWAIGFDLAVRTVLMLVVVGLLNLIGAKFFQRLYLSSQTRVALSPRTDSLLRSLTNSVAVTLFYDRKGDYYSTVAALLNEYRDRNPRISVRTVDYIRDAGEAEKVKARYNLADAGGRDLAIFDCGGRVKVVTGEAIVQTQLEQTAPSSPGQKELEFRRKPVAFNGEKIFTSILLSLQNPEPLKACYLQGHGEPSLADTGEFGYMKFGALLQQSYVAVTNLELLGESPVPADCNLLIIAAPAARLSPPELQKIDQYLGQGGRLLVLFNYASVNKDTGIEPLLQRWGVNVLHDVVQDPKNTVTGQDVVVRQFSQFPVVDSLSQLSLQMVLPRPVRRIEQANPPAGAPDVKELAFSGPASTLAVDRGLSPQSHPLIAAVDQKPAAGVANARGTTTRIIVAGDSVFLGNYYIEGAANRDFLNGAVGWLLDRPQLLEGIGPRPVTEFRLMLTRHQQAQLRWILLGALPGGVLFLGWVVWLFRRQ